MHALIKKLGLEDRLRRDNLSRYLLQCTLASVFVLILLLILDSVTQTVLIAALGASTFIAFAVPRSLQSDPRYMIGGYLVGILVGSSIGTLNASILYTDVVTAHVAMIVFGALATGLAMLVMVITKTEHPPAAALALGLVLNEWNLLTLVVVILGVIALSICKRLVLPILMDLL
jgi:CBS-domain-containing membrane protein